MYQARPRPNGAGVQRIKQLDAIIIDVMKAMARGAE